MTTVDTMELRARLLAELRDSPHPLSTTELAAQIPWKVERSEDNCVLLCNRRTPNPDVRVVECHRSWHLVAYRRTAHGYTGIYRHLRSLERQGLVRRTLREGRKRVRWVYTGSDRPAPTAQNHGTTGRDSENVADSCSNAIDTQEF
jgi:hypothetical protein